MIMTNDRNRDEPILLLESPIFLSSNSFKIYLLLPRFCSQKSLLLIKISSLLIKTHFYLILSLIAHINKITGRLSN